jgi:hypothetical protein
MQKLKSQKNEKSEVTAESTLIELQSIGKTDCGACGHCCEYGSGYLLDEDIKRLAEHFQISKEEFLKRYAEPITIFNTKGWRLRQIRTKFPAGQCVLYDKQKKCTVHEKKPVYCSITTCKPCGGDIVHWFRYHHYVNKNDKVSVDEYNRLKQFFTSLKDGEQITGTKNKKIKQKNKGDKNGRKS